MENNPNLSLKEQAKLLFQNGEYDLFRSWFAYADTIEEQAEKILIWCRFFLPDYFRDTSPAFHKELLVYLLTTKNEYIAAPRGFAKTTVIQGFIMFCIAYKLKKFIVVLEKTSTESDEMLQAIRDQFKHNEWIHKFYGGDLVKRDATGTYDRKNKDSENDLLINGVRLRGKGFNTPIRGLKSKQHRPDLIIADDVEEDEHIRSDDQRQKYYNNLTSGVMPAIDIGDEGEVGGTLKMFGTILHYDSLLQNQINLHGGKIYEAYDLNASPEDRDATMLWPSRWTFERLEAKRKEMMQEGKGSSSYYQEYHNRPVNDETRTFKHEWLNLTYTPSVLSTITTKRFTILDVAETVQDKSDFTGQVTFNVSPENYWYISRAKRHKLNILGLIKLIFDIWINEKPDIIGIEKKALEDQIMPLLKVESRKRNVYPIIVELKHGGRHKEDRIKGALQGRFEYGMIYFLEGATDDQGLLKSELIDFPSAKHDDLSDALAYGEQFAYEPSNSKTTKSVEQPDMDDSFKDAIAGSPEEPQSWLDY